MHSVIESVKHLHNLIVNTRQPGEDDMEKRSDQIAKLIAKGQPAQTEPIAFGPDEMIVCGKCGRKSPPNRLDCIYCAARLEIAGHDSETIKLNLRKLESWEKGFNVIYLTNPHELSEADLARVGRFLDKEIEAVRSIFAFGKPMLLARVESDEEAVIMEARLRELDVECRTISDEILNADIVPRRLRGLEVSDDQVNLADFNSDKKFAIRRDDLALIVVGEVFETISESTEKRKKGKSSVLEQTETSVDEIVIDLYTKNDSTGFRIPMTGFDFSCLGDDKGMLARENIRALVIALKEIAPNARLDRNYHEAKDFLNDVWEIEQRKDTQGLRRQNFGNLKMGHVASSSNLKQFTKYSRLQWHLL